MTTAPATRVAAESAAVAFRTLARLRGSRALHPVGPLLRGTMVMEPVAGVPALAARRRVEAVVRVSRALGAPAGRPDIRGLAMRLLDLHGPGAHQDLLLASCGPPPLHVLLLPARDTQRCWYTSLLPYRLGPRRRILVAHGDGAGGWRLEHAGVGRAREPLGVLTTETPLEPSPGESVRFDAMRWAARGFRQAAGPLDVIRTRAYAASREGHPGG